MKVQQFLLAVMFSVVLSGCLWPFHSRAPSSSTSTPGSSISVEVLRPDILSKGGKMVFIPFTAGINAEAGQQLDRLALMILKGTLDVFQESSSSIQMINQGDPDAADMILDGHVEEFRSTGGWKPAGIGKKPGVMVVTAEVRSRRTNEVLVLIAGRREFKDAKKAEALAYDIGRGIAEQLIQQESRP